MLSEMKQGGQLCDWYFKLVLIIGCLSIENLYVFEFGLSRPITKIYTLFFRYLYIGIIIIYTQIFLQVGYWETFFKYFHYLGLLELPHVVINMETFF